MTSRWKIGVLAWVAMCGVSLAQTVSNAAPNNEQLVQSFRALLSSSSDTQAVMRAVADAVRQALQQGPVTAEQAQSAALAAAPAPAAAPAAIPPKTWADSIVLKGDVRFREELRQDHAGNSKDPNADVDYDRIRVRFGAEAQINDNVKAVVRLGADGYGSDRTGNGGDPTSNNQDLNNGASKKDIFLEASRQFYAQVLRHLEESFSSSPSFRESRVDLRRIVETLDTLPDLLWDFQKELLGLVSMDSDVKACAEQHREEVIGLIAKYLAPMNGGKGCSREGIVLAVTFLQGFFLLFEDIKEDRTVRLETEFNLMAKALAAVLLVEDD